MDAIRTTLPDALTRESPGTSHEERKTRRPRRSSVQAKGESGLRYFLAAEGSGKDSSPLALGEEFASEDEVLIASLKRDVPFYRVETWRTVAEKKGRNMVVRKQS